MEYTIIFTSKQKDVLKELGVKLNATSAYSEEGWDDILDIVEKYYFENVNDFELWPVPEKMLEVEAILYLINDKVDSIN
ncbi:MAG: hypothetical protein ACRC6H_07080 [Culicoidibacterales bacterium]